MPAPASAFDAACDCCGRFASSATLGRFYPPGSDDPVRTASGRVARLCAWCVLDCTDAPLLDTLRAIATQDNAVREVAATYWPGTCAGPLPDPLAAVLAAQTGAVVAALRGPEPRADLTNVPRLRLLPAGDARGPDDERGNHPAE